MTENFRLYLLWRRISHGGRRSPPHPCPECNTMMTAREIDQYNELLAMTLEPIRD
jgi:hypothetical protein